MKTLNFITLAMICTMLCAAAKNMSSAGAIRLGRGSHQLGRLQPWGPGWVRPHQKLDTATFRVEPLRQPSAL